MQFQGKRMIQTQENDENSLLGPDLSPLGPSSGRQFFCKNLATSVTICHGQLSSCTISEKSNDLILNKDLDLTLTTPKVDI